MQDFDGDSKNGIVHTDFILIERMLSLFPESMFGNADLKWLDPCAGQGYFAEILLKRLLLSLNPPNNTREYIIKNMLYMVEIDLSYVNILREKFGKDANILHRPWAGLVPIFGLYKPT